MITLLSSLKPFHGETGLLQERTLSNWRRLAPEIEILLYGDGEGIAERARRFGARHVTEIRKSEGGVPDFSAIAEHARQNGKYGIQVYLNGDILLPPTFHRELLRIGLDRYLISGQRIDLSRGAVFDHLSTEWNREILRCSSVRQASLHEATGMDYFVFPRGQWEGLAPLTIGRVGYDSALVANCLRRRIPVVDATKTLHIVHQWHDYSHLSGDRARIARREVLSNLRVHDIEHSRPTIADASYELRDGDLTCNKPTKNAIRRLEVLLRYEHDCKYTSYILRAAWRFSCKVGLMREEKLSVEDLFLAHDLVGSR